MKKYKKPRDELVCIPSGFVREDGTEIMAWTLRKFVEGTPEENYDYLTNDYEQDLYSTKEQYVFMIKEDDEQDTYTMQEHVTEEKINQTENNLQSGSTTNSKHDKLFKIILSNKQEAVGFIKMVMKPKEDITTKNIELYNKE